MCTLSGKGFLTARKYLIWFLCDDSNWLPSDIHEFLLEGMKNWAIWEDYRPTETYDYSSDAFLDRLFRSRSFKTFRLTKNVRISLEGRIKRALKTLGLNESATKIYDRFLQNGIIERWFDIHEERSKRRRS